MIRRVRFRHRWDGGVIETDLILCKRREWRRMIESHDPAWSVHEHGGRVVALRLPDGLPRRRDE